LATGTVELSRRSSWRSADAMRCHLPTDESNAAGVSATRCPQQTPSQSGGRQPAVVLRYERCAARNALRSATSERTNKSGRRQPAVVWIRTCDGDRLFRIEYVLRRTCGCGATAGLRQPLLVARRLFGARCATRNAQACVQPRAAGVSPPWFGDTNVVQRETRFVQRLANGRTRAAGVSPPWFEFALATAFR
jgi:hypothetical protein